MNIKFTHSMLLTFLDTDASPEEIQEYVSLGGPNVETIEKVSNDYVYDVEVTSNRIDAASALGFAMECAAILPRYNKKAHLVNNPLDNSAVNASHQAKDVFSLDINLADDSLAQRIMAVVFSNITISSEQTDMGRQLELCGERSINTIVDLSNYLRILLGHPVHMFDFDKISGQKMIIRSSKEDEVITTLDGKEIKLPGNDIVVEDEDGNLIDLAGIMGGKNSEITQDTHTIVFFVPTFNGTHIRKTSMKTGQRTNAVAYFEKNVDPHRAGAVFTYGSTLIEKLGGLVASDVVDIFPHQKSSHNVEVSVEYVNTLCSMHLTNDEMSELIEPLGFKAISSSSSGITFSIPSYRALDVTNQSDIAEEVARIYGYHNIENNMHTGLVISQPQDIKDLFQTQKQIRAYCSSIGFNEQYNYSMISKDLIEKCDGNVGDYLKLENSISEEIEYLRTSLVPSLVKNVADNIGRASSFNFFECARIYSKQENALPLEREHVGFISTNDYFYLKGIVENSLELLHVGNYSFLPCQEITYLAEGIQAKIMVGTTEIGYIGTLRTSIALAHDIPFQVSVAELYLKDLIDVILPIQPYSTPHTFARIKRDITYQSDKDHMYGDLKLKAFSTSKLLLSFDVISIYQDKVSVRMEFGYADKNITESEALVEFEKIKALV